MLALTQVGAKLTRGSPAAVGGGVSVDHLVVQPVVRSNRSSHAAPDADAAHRRKVNVLFLGESNICRSVLASGIMQQLLHGSGLDGMVDCESMVWGYGDIDWMHACAACCSGIG
eukprot:365126-Chlamydomonas_euryale.AAC.53